MAHCLNISLFFNNYIIIILWPVFYGRSRIPIFCNTWKILSVVTISENRILTTNMSDPLTSPHLENLTKRVTRYGLSVSALSIIRVLIVPQWAFPNPWYITEQPLDHSLISCTSPLPAICFQEFFLLFVSPTRRLMYVWLNNGVSLGRRFV